MASAEVHKEGYLIISPTHLHTNLPKNDCLDCILLISVANRIDKHICNKNKNKIKGLDYYLPELK